jgi:FixJ family two-component response regulator
VADFLRRADAEPPSLFDRLTSREREELQLVVEGHTNSTVAQMLKVGMRSVERDRASLMCNLNAHDLGGLMRTATKHRLVLPAE